MLLFLVSICDRKKMLMIYVERGKIYPATQNVMVIIRLVREQVTHVVCNGLTFLVIVCSLIRYRGFAKVKAVGFTDAFIKTE